jgi:serine phosphatase RsbU (regulator of sigma subunit)
MRNRRRRRKTQLNRDKNYHIGWFISLLIGLLGLLMLFICYKDGNKSMVIVSIAYSAAMFITFVFINITKKLVLFYFTGPLVIITLEVVFLLNGGSKGFGIIWMTVIPLFTLYLLPTISFFSLNAVVFLLLILGMWTPLKYDCYPYSPFFSARFPIVYMISFIFTSFLKHRIQLTEDELKDQKNLLASEIEQAAFIQQTFYQQKIINFDNWEVAFKCVPMAGVSGDLYDFYPKKEMQKAYSANSLDGTGTLLGAGIFDISGHGISSGIITLLAKNIIVQEFYDGFSKPLWQTVQNINERFIVEKGGIENYITGILLRFKKDSVELVNSGHQKPLLYKKSNGSFQFIENSPLAFGAIGLSTIPSSYDSLFVEMKSGDELILYTDGIVDKPNVKGDSFGHKAFVESLSRTVGLPVETQLSALFDELDVFASGTEPEDDMTLIILKKK